MSGKVGIGMKFAAALVFLCGLAAALPLAWGKLFQGSVLFFGDVPGADLPVLALFALAGIAMSWGGVRWIVERDRFVFIAFLVAVAGVVAGGFQLWYFGGTWRQFLTGLFYFAVPAAGMVLTHEWKRVLPGFLMLFGAADLLISCREILENGVAVGVSGNWNWNWTLLTVSLPAWAFLLPEKRRIRGALVLGVAIAVGQMFLFSDYSSRGTLLAAVTAALFLGAAAWLHRHPAWRTRAGIIIAAAVLAGACVAFALLYSDVPDRRESRIALWRGAAALAAAHPVAGVGPARFEDRIGAYLPAEYYDGRFASDRHPHPHNEYLFWWCGFGIVGVAWALILTWGGLRGVLRRRRADFPLFLCAWGFLVLLCHGQFDVLLGTPVAGGLFLLMNGVLFRCGLPREPRKRPTAGMAVAAGLFWVCGGALLILNLAGGWYCREGKLALIRSPRDAAAAKSALARSAALVPSAETLYVLSGVELFDFHDPAAAARTLERLPKEAGIAAYSHSTGRMARALAASGKFEASLPYFEAEQKTFPRSAVNAGLHRAVLLQLGRRGEAEKVDALWKELLERKNVTPEEFPQLLRNPLLDDNAADREVFFREHRRK